MGFFNRNRLLCKSNGLKFNSNNTTASGLGSTTMGFYTTASGNYSIAMGSYGNTNSHTGLFIIHDHIDENVYGITQNNLDNQLNYIKAV